MQCCLASKNLCQKSKIARTADNEFSPNLTTIRRYSVRKKPQRIKQNVFESFDKKKLFYSNTHQPRIIRAKQNISVSFGVF